MSPWNYTKLAENETEDVKNASEIPASVVRKLRLYQLAAGVLLALNIGFASVYLRSSQDCIRPQLVYSPSKTVTQYEKRRLFRSIEHNVYTGAPRPEHDQAWAKLIEPITIKISEEELDLIGEKSIALADKSGYIAETAKRIRRHLYLDYYYPNMTEDQRLREGPHIDHCLEYMREAAMCRGDTTLSSFRWAAHKPFSHVYSDHECVNWQTLDTWARSRMVDMSDISILAPERSGESEALPKDESIHHHSFLG